MKMRREKRGRRTDMVECRRARYGIEGNRREGRGREKTERSAGERSEREWKKNITFSHHGFHLLHFFTAHHLREVLSHVGHVMPLGMFMSFQVFHLKRYHTKENINVWSQVY